MTEILKTELTPCGIDVNKIDGRIAIATSSLTGEIWDGEAILFNSTTKQSQSFCNSSGLTSIRWLAHTIPLVLGACDDGTIAIWDLSRPPQKEEQEQESFERNRLHGHDDIVSSLSVFQDGQFISGSFDGSVRLWHADGRGDSLQTFKTNQNTNNHILCVNCDPTNPNCFVSSCSNGHLYAFDKRVSSSAEKSSSSAVSDFLIGDYVISSVCYSPNSQSIVCGDEDGCITAIDPRNANGSPLLKKQIHSLNITNCVFHPESNDIFASCSEDGFIRVMSISKQIILFESFPHNGQFVTSLYWLNSSTLLSTGRDYRLISSSISF